MRKMPKGYVIIACFALISCEQTSVEEDMKEYCECIKENKGEVGPRCKILIEEMSTKYEYDPEASEYIIEHLEDCVD